MNPIPLGIKVFSGFAKSSWPFYTHGQGPWHKNDKRILVVMVVNHYKVMVKRSESAIHFLANEGN